MNLATVSTAAPATEHAQFPIKLQFLFSPARYKVAYGGRGGAKSWGFARALLIQGAQRPLRILCARETQKSIEDSVHKLLEDQIRMLGMQDTYTVQRSSVYGVNGTEFTFHGLKHNITNIKSLESFDIVWVEEAQVVSKQSWDVLIPTIRKEGSEIWVSFNPDLEEDNTYQRFVANPPPPGAVVVKMNFRDNPWFPEVLELERVHLQRLDPESYDHIWEGNCQSAVAGAIYHEQLQRLQQLGRITTVPYDPSLPVHTFWDLGFGDMVSIWMAQATGTEYHLIDYEEDSQKDIAHYLKRLQTREYVWGTDWLPWDGKAKELGSGKSIEERIRAVGRHVRVTPRLAKHDGINAARLTLPLCWFDSEKTNLGLHGLRHYQWATDANGNPTREPKHDWASHPADAFRTMAVAIKQPNLARPGRGVPLSGPQRFPVGPWS